MFTVIVSYIINDSFIFKAFGMEIRMKEHLSQHLMHTFDHVFATPDKQWSIDKVDYQLQFMLTLIAKDQEKLNYFPTPDIENNTILSSIILLKDPFVYMVSLINYLKEQFANRHSKCIRWLNIDRCDWKCHEDEVRNSDLLKYSYQEKSIEICITWHIKPLEEENFWLHMNAKIPEEIDFEMPLGDWKKPKQENDLETLRLYVELEMKTLIACFINLSQCK